MIEDHIKINSIQVAYYYAKDPYLLVRAFCIIHKTLLQCYVI